MGGKLVRGRKGWGNFKICGDELILDILKFQIKIKALKGDCLFKLSTGARFEKIVWELNSLVFDDIQRNRYD